MIERKISKPSTTAPRIEDLEDGLRIDENALDDEIQSHPDMFYQVSKALQMLISRRDAAKQNKEEIEARVDAEIRHNAEVNEEKIRETEVESTKRRHAHVIKAMDQLAALNEQVGQWAALKESFQQRSYMLRSMVDLYVAGYFESNISASSARMKEHDTDKTKREMAQMRRDNADNRG